MRTKNVEVWFVFLLFLFCRDLAEILDQRSWAITNALIFIG